MKRITKRGRMILIQTLCHRYKSAEPTSSYAQCALLVIKQIRNGKELC
jgi:hypothetical protein